MNRAKLNYARQERPVTLAITFVLIVAAILLVHDSAPAQDITPTSVTLRWTAPGDNGTEGQASQYDIRYSTSPINSSNFSSAIQASGEPVPQPAGSDESFTVTGLQPATTYFFAIKAADEIPNWSALSNVISRTTLDETAAPADIADLEVSSPGLTSLTLSWTSPGDDGNSGTADQYDIRYSLVPITLANWNTATQVSGEPSPQAAGSNEQFVVTGLNESTTYYFAIMTADEVPNWSDLSNIASGITSTESTAPSNIADLQIENVTSGSVTLAWHAPGDDGTVGTASEYDIRYSTSPINAGNWNDAVRIDNEPTPASAGTAQSVIVSGLDPDTDYYFAVRAADEVPNWSGLSNVVHTTTIDNVAPSAIMDLTAVTGQDAGELTLNWTAPGDNGNEGTASHYLILYSNDSITSDNWEQADLCVSPPSPLPAGAEQNFVLCDLDPGEEYCVAIKSVDGSANISELSNCVSAVSQTGFILDVDDDEFTELPETFQLAQNYPNPFNPSTIIEYALPTVSYVNVSIYNVLGQQITTLVSQLQSPGYHSIEWDGTDSRGRKAASGVYLYKIVAGDFTQSKKMMMVQ